jgi:hypothetical protein
VISAESADITPGIVELFIQAKRSRRGTDLYKNDFKNYIARGHWRAIRRWVQPTANGARTVGCTHPTIAPSLPCEISQNGDRLRPQAAPVPIVLWAARKTDQPPNCLAIRLVEWWSSSRTDSSR